MMTICSIKLLSVKIFGKILFTETKQAYRYMCCMETVDFKKFSCKHYYR